MKSALRITILSSVLATLIAIAQTRSEGSAIVTAGGREYSIPIICDDPNRPELGFSTEPSRVTRAATGRTSGVNLRVRRWQDTNELVVSLDRYVAWMPMVESVSGVLTVELDMSPNSVTNNGVPALLTHEDWSQGERPFGISGVKFKADCRVREDGIPKSRKISE